MSSTPPDGHHDRPIPPPGAPLPPPGGTLASQPSLPTPLTEAEAIDRALRETATADTAKVTVSVMPYREHLRHMDHYAVQLDLTAPVIHVAVEAPFVARLGSARPGRPRMYRRYEIGFDPRTGWSLGIRACGLIDSAGS